jgi:hypothetical protein
VTVVYERLHARTAERRRALSSGLPLAILTAIVLAVALESARRGLGMPSLVDDWFGIAYSGHAFEAIKHLNYGAAHTDFAGRYRPAYTGGWNYLQWHALGAPSVHVAMAWGAARIVSFVCAVWVAARWTAGRGPLSAVAAALAAAAVCLTPGFAVDLTRYGPADILMLAGLILGLATIGFGVRALLAADAVHRGRLVLLVALGYIVYVFGAYSKEASVALIALAPFFVKWAGPALRVQVTGSRARRYSVGLLAALLAVPLIHIGAHVALAVANGENPYPTANFSFSRKVLVAGAFPFMGAPAALGTDFWLVVTPAAIAYATRTAWKRERDAWLLFGLLTTGFLMSAFSLARGDAVSRYYLPWIVAVAAVGARALTKPNTRVLAYFAPVVLLIMAATGTRDALAAWRSEETSGAVAVKMAKSVVSAGCPLYLANFGVERRVAIPRLLGMAHTRPVARCAQPAQVAYALQWRSGSLPAPLARRCRGDWKKLKERSGVSLYRCRAFERSSYLDQDAASSLPAVKVVRLRVPIHDRLPGTSTPPARTSLPGAIAG